MAVKEYYKILGVGESASSDEIKKAYRKLAKENHPDANPCNKAAEDKFKEISEAYNVLGDSKKRKQYNQMRKFGGDPRGFAGQGFGGQGFDFSEFDFSQFGFGNLRNASKQNRQGGFSSGGFGSFGGLGDIFSQFLDLGNGAGQQQSGPQKGEDIKVDLSIPFELSITGGKINFSVEKEKVCPSCKGGGAKPGSTVQTCSKCRGTGSVTIAQGVFGVSRPCPTCFGKGQIIENPCNKCYGSGQVTGKRTYAVKIPAGIQSCEQIRLKKEGKKGVEGGPPGDMILIARIKSHTFFKRNGDDINCDVTLTLKQAVNGSSLRVKTVHGNKVLVKIPPGTQDGKILRLGNMGLSRNGKKGDQYVTVHVMLPENPTDEEKELIEQYNKTG